MRRQFARFACDIEVSGSVSPPDAPKRKRGAPARLLNISIGGALLSFPGALTMKRVRLEVPEDKRFWTVEARVVRDAGPDADREGSRCYGLIFDPSPRAETRIRRFVDRIRGGSGMGEDVKRDYWNL